MTVYLEQSSEVNTVVSYIMVKVGVYSKYVAHAQTIRRSLGRRFLPRTAALLGERERAHIVVLLEPPSISLYIIMSSGDATFWSPRAPAFTRKRKAGTITSGY